MPDANDIFFTVEPSFFYCMTKCHESFGCTHVSYTYRDFQPYQKGSCWLKNNTIKQDSAINKTCFASAILNQGNIF